MLSRTQIAQEIEIRTGIKPNQTRNTLKALAEIAEEEIAKGEDFTVPGIARVSFRYTSPRKKGEAYVGFGGVDMVAEKARPEKVAIRAGVVSALKQCMPNKGTKGYKNVVARKAK